MKIGEYELLIIAGGQVTDPVIPELVDTETNKTYIIGKDVGGFYCGPHSVVFNRTISVSNTEQKTCKFTIPAIVMEKNSNNTMNPTIKAVFREANIEKRAAFTFERSLENKANSTSNKKSVVDSLVVGFGESEPRHQASQVSVYVLHGDILATFEFWAQSSSALQVSGVLPRCWPALFEAKLNTVGLSRNDLKLPKFSCGFALSSIENLNEKRNSEPNSDELLDKALKKCGLCLSSGPAMGMKEVCGLIMTGAKNENFEQFLTNEFGDNFTLQAFANHFGVPLYIYQHSSESENTAANTTTTTTNTTTSTSNSNSNSNSNNNNNNNNSISNSNSNSNNNSSTNINSNNTSTKSKKLEVFEIMPVEGKRIWPVGYAIAFVGRDNWRIISYHDFVTIDDDDNGEDAAKAAEQAEKLAELQRKREEVRKKREALLRQEEELLQEESLLSQQTPSKRIKQEPRVNVVEY